VQAAWRVDRVTHARPWYKRAYATPADQWDPAPFNTIMLGDHPTRSIADLCDVAEIFPEYCSPSAQQGGQLSEIAQKRRKEKEEQRVESKAAKAAEKKHKEHAEAVAVPATATHALRAHFEEWKTHCPEVAPSTMPVSVAMQVLRAFIAANRSRVAMNAPPWG
jgi:hypothetical protein